MSDETSFDPSEFTTDGDEQLITSGSLAAAAGANFFKAAHVVKPEVHIIKGYGQHQFQLRDGDDPARNRPKKTLVFSDESRRLVLNMTMETMLRELFGDNIADHIGKRVELYRDKTSNPKGERVDCIRLRAAAAQ